MLKDCNAVWDNCINTIRRNVNAQSFKTWFEPIKPVRLDGAALTIQVPNKFFYEWLEEHYVALLKMTIRQELGEKGRLDYQILMGKNADANSTPKTPTMAATAIAPTNVAINYAANNAASSSRTVAASSTPDNTQQIQHQRPIEVENIKNPFVIPGIKKVQIDPQTNPNYLFENYIEGDCNRLARSAGIAVAKKPGGTAFNPLFIFGDVGLGKTHLAQAIGNEAMRKDPNKTTLYVSSEKFTNQIIEAIKTNSVTDFVNFYQMVDILIVDDIQFLANKTKTQEIFFHIFNQLHQGGKQLILTSDRPPKDLEGMEERLISRFKWGLSADLHAPDIETRIAILQAKMTKDGIEMPPDVVAFVCSNVKNNIRELEGVLISIIAQSSLNKQGVDVSLAKNVVKNFVTEEGEEKEVSIDAIQQMVAEHLKIPFDKLLSQTRKRSIVVARQLSMYLAKNLTTISLKNIGEAFGGRDHSTVIYSCKAVQDMIDTDLIFKDTVEQLEKKIKIYGASI